MTAEEGDVDTHWRKDLKQGGHVLYDMRQIQHVKVDKIQKKNTHTHIRKLYASF